MSKINKHFKKFLVREGIDEDKFIELLKVIKFDHKMVLSGDEKLIIHISKFKDRYNLSKRDTLFLLTEYIRVYDDTVKKMKSGEMDIIKKEYRSKKRIV